MNLLKAKRQVEEQDVNEFREKKEKYLERKKQKKQLNQSLYGIGSPSTEDGEEEATELASKLSSTKSGVDDNTFVRFARYIGTFSVNGTDPQTRAEFVRRQLTHMQNAVRGKPVLLVISLAGIKICDRKGQSVMMAHSLRRISYATCDPNTKQFAFLAREPKGQVNVQHCYTFVTNESSQAEELNSIIGNVFAMAGEQKKEYENRMAEDTEELLEQERKRYFQVQYKALEAQKANQTSSNQSCEPNSVTNTNNNNSNMAKVCQTQPESSARDGLCADRSCDYITHAPATIAAPTISPAGTSCSAATTSSYMDLSSKSSSTTSSDRDSEIYALNSNGGSLYYDAGGSEAFGQELYSEQCGNCLKNNGLNSRMEGINVENYMDPVSKYDRPGQDGSRNSYVGFHKMDSIRYRPLPLIPHSSGNQSSSSSLPPRYQNDSPFVYNSKRSSQMSLSTPADSSNVYSSKNRTLQDDMLSADAWYKPDLPREQALQILQNQDLGAFLIRDSATHPGCFALSVKVPKFDNPTGITHYLIQRTKAGGVKMKGLDKEWPCLEALVVHHSIMAELLPCTLKVTKTTRRSNPSASRTANGYRNSGPVGPSTTTSAGAPGMQRSASTLGVPLATMRATSRPVFRRAVSSYDQEPFTERPLV